VFIRPESLSVKGREHVFVYVIMQIINIIYKHHYVSNDHEDIMMGD
jgi:hypothetical protein